MASALRLVTPKLSVAVIKDDAVTREGVAALLAQDGGFTVITSGSEISAPTLAAARPDVFLVDAQLLISNGARLAQALRAASADAKIVATGISGDQKGLVSLVRSGVAGFVMKDASVTELAESIRSVAAGNQVLPAVLTAAMFRSISRDTDDQDEMTPPALDRMTAREREVSLLIAQGKSNKEIAIAAHISTNTVKCHVRNIMEKLALHTRLQIAAKANAERWAMRLRGDEGIEPRPMLRSVPTNNYTTF